MNSTLNDQMNEIRARIAKLNALKEGAKSEGEAAAAAAAISRLLFKHNIDMADIPDIEELYEEPFTAEEWDLRPKRSKNQSNNKPSYDAVGWREQLVFVIAKYNFCKIIRLISQGPSMKKNGEVRKNGAAKSSGFIGIVGQPTNVEVVKALYKYLENEIIVATRNAWKVEKDLNPFTNENDWKRSYRYGIVTTILARFEAGRRNDIADDEERGNALVIVKEKKLNDAFNAAFTSSGSAKPPARNLSWNGYAGGQERGKTMKIQHEFGNNRLALTGN